MPAWQVAATEKDFPEPLQILLWRRRGSSGTCAIFKNLSLVKSSITSDCHGDDTLRYDYTVYEWDGTSWVSIYKLTKGDSKKAHELWAKGAAPKHSQVANPEAEKAALASILSAFKSD